MREFAGLTLHGLVWTFPSGYLLHHMGYGWEYALSGGAMSHLHIAHSHSHPAQPRWDWHTTPRTSLRTRTLASATRSSLVRALRGGTAPTRPGDFLFGAWMWIALISMVLAQHKHAKLYSSFAPNPAGAWRRLLDRNGDRRADEAVDLYGNSEMTDAPKQSACTA